MNRFLRGALTALVLLVLALVAAFPSRAEAQGFALVPAGPNTLSGIVTDSSGNPIADVSVFIERLARRVRTRADGRYHFDRIAPGRYSVTARRIGYVGETRDVDVRENGGAARFQMIPAPFALQTFVTVAARGGLSGVIGDTSYRALAGVEVRVMGSPHTARTDSSGSFFLPVKPGRYFVMLKRDGYAYQTVSVIVPETQGRKIAAWLVPSREKPNPRDAVALFDLPARMMRASRASSRFYTREDIERMGGANLSQIVAAGAVRRVDQSCGVIVDGDPQRYTGLGTLDPEQVEFLEVYVDPAQGGTSGPGVAFGRLARQQQRRLEMQQPLPTGCGVTVYAWLRR